MFRARRRKHFISRPAHGDALQNFLKLALGIDVDRFFSHLLEGSTRFAQNKIARCREIAIEINRADNRLESVAQSGSPHAAAACFLATSHQQMPSEIERLGVRLERVPRNQARAQFRERSFLFLVENERRDIPL